MSILAQKDGINSAFLQALVSSGRQTSFLDSPEVPQQINVEMDMTHFHHLGSDFTEVSLLMATALVAVREHDMGAMTWLQEFLQAPQLLLSRG